jgi:hypothetical protein
LDAQTEQTPSENFRRLKLFSKGLYEKQKRQDRALFNTTSRRACDVQGGAIRQPNGRPKGSRINRRWRSPISWKHLAAILSRVWPRLLWMRRQVVSICAQMYKKLTSYVAPSARLVEMKVEGTSPSLHHRLARPAPRKSCSFKERAARAPEAVARDEVLQARAEQLHDQNAYRITFRKY